MKYYKIVFLCIIIFLVAFITCDTRKPTEFEESPILELSSKDSVITYPFPPEFDAQGNDITKDYIEIDAKLMNANRGRVTDSSNIHFFSSVGSITGIASTGDTGVATAHYFPKERSETYFDSIWACFSYNNNEDTIWANITIKIQPKKSGTTGEVGAIQLTASPATVQVKGTGGNEQSAVTALVTDNQNDVIGDAVVIFEIASGPGGGEYISKDTVTTENDGTATTTFKSGSKTGVVSIKAKSGTYETDPKSLIAITSGPPTNISISPVLDQVSKESGGAQWIMYLHAKLTDANYNEVSDGWAVSFQLDSTFTYQTITAYPAPETTLHVANLEGISINSGSATGKRYATKTNGDPQESLPGIAETYIKYPTSAIFDSVKITAKTKVDTQEITESEAIGLPLPVGGITITAAKYPGTNVLVQGYSGRDTAKIVGILMDGLIPIADARIRIESSLGDFLVSARADSNGICKTDENGQAEFLLEFGPQHRPNMDESAFVTDIKLFVVDQPGIANATVTITVIFQGT